MTVIIHLQSVRPYHVHTDTVAMVLRGAGRQEYIPVLDTYGRPTGYDNQQVIQVALVLPQPYRETQVITYSQTYLDAAVLKDRPLIAGREKLRFPAAGVQMMLVVVLRSVMGTEEETAIAQPAVIRRHQRTNDSQIIRISHALECLTCRSLRPWFSQSRTVRTKTGTEHLRHYGDVCPACYCPQTLVQQAYVRLRICPLNRVL